MGQISKFISKITGKPRQETDVAIDEMEEPSEQIEPIPAESTPAQLVIPGHELLGKIGSGAYGEVWLARDEIGAYHGVKIIYKRTFADRGPFEREYHGILQYTPISRTHHGLVPILHVGRETEAGFFYYVMELADCCVSGRAIHPETYRARSLAHELDTRGRLPARECLDLALDLTEALRYLHSKQLIHRDIKPANIIYVNGIAKLADVGLVTHTAEARRDPKHLGTEGFTPPEGPGTPWADVYSLGKVLCEASLGPAGLEGVPVSLDGVEEPERGALQQVTAIFFKACHEELENRYQSIDEMQADLMLASDEI